MVGSHPLTSPLFLAQFYWTVLPNNISAQRVPVQDAGRNALYSAESLSRRDGFRYFDTVFVLEVEDLNWIIKRKYLLILSNK